MSLIERFHCISDTQYRFDVPFKVLARQVGLYILAICTAFSVDLGNTRSVVFVVVLIVAVVVYLCYRRLIPPHHARAERSSETRRECRS